MNPQTVILIGIGGYVLLMLAVGAYASRKSHSLTEFVVAGRSLPLWLCTMTIVATWFGGGMMLGGAGAAYEEGVIGTIADPFGATVCLLLVGLFFARLIRRLRIFTFVEFVEQRFGISAGVITSAAALMSSIFWVAGMLVAFGVVFETLTGLPLLLGICGGALVVIVYTSIGGLLAVALTDFVQMTIIAVGLLVLLATVLIDNGGWSAVMSQAPENTWRMIPFENTGEQWLNYIRAWVIFGLADITSQSLQQRAMAAKNERVAQNSFYLAAIFYLLLGMVPVLLGIIGNITLPGLASPESVVPALALEHLHPVALAVFVGALLAAIMSSSDSALLGSATILSTNVLPLLVKKPSEEMRLKAVRWGVPLAGLIAVAVALKARVIFETVLDANLLILAAIIVPFILGVWWKKANRAGALAAMLTGIVAWLATSFVYPELPGDLVGLGASLAAMLLVTPLTQKLDPPRGLVDRDGNPVELSARLGVPGFSGP